MTYDSTDRATQLLAMTQRLVGLVAAEIEAMRSHKLQGHSAEWDEKERLVHAWRIEVSKVKAQPDLLAGISAELKADPPSASAQASTNAKDRAEG